MSQQYKKNSLTPVTVEKTIQGYHPDTKEKITPPDTPQPAASLESSGSGLSTLESGRPSESDDDVDWNNDPSNPRNWSPGRKWTAAGIVSMYAFLAPLSSSMLAPGLPEIAMKYNITNSTVLAMTLSIPLLTSAFGPLFLAPLTEMYGRTYLYNICILLSIALNLGCAYSPTAGALIGFRLLEGLSASSAFLACGNGSISDIFSERDRALPMGLFTLAPLISRVIGPIAGGFIFQTVGIKWVFITVAALCGVASLVGIPLLRETYAPVIRYRKALVSADSEKIARTRVALMQGANGRLAYMWTSFTRPVVIFFTSLTCFILGLYFAFMDGIFFLMVVTFPKFFAETYGFGPGINGFAYLGLGLGYCCATIVGGKLSDKIYTYLAEKRGGKGTPEMRMPLLLFGSFFVPAGLFWYGWSAQAKLHWIMPIAGSCIFGFGAMTTTLPIMLYIVDTFEFAASATAAAFVVHGIFSFSFPLFGQQMFDRLGLGGGNSLLAGLAMLLAIPFPVWIYYKGESIRQKGNTNRL